MSKQSRGLIGGPTVIRLTILLVISVFSMGMAVPGQDGDETVPHITSWTESPTRASVDGSLSEADGDGEVPASEPASVSDSPISDATSSAGGTSPTPVASTEGQPGLPAVNDEALESPAARPEVKDRGIMPMAVPNPGTNQAVITVKVGDARTGLAVVGGLAGVRLGLFANANDAAPVVGNWSTCTADGSGDCSFIVPNVAKTGSGTNERCATTISANCDKRFWVKQISTPITHYLNTTLGPTGGESSYVFQTGTRLRSGSTYRSTSDFMFGSGNTNYVASNGIWQNSRLNPRFPDKCGISVGLVLDLSNSVTASDFVQLKKAASGLVDSLTGTPSQVGLFTFGTNAPASAGQTLEAASVSTQSGANTVKAKLNGYTLPGGQAGGTNWDRGLYQVVQAASDFDVVIVITDGNPTFSGDGVGPGNATRFAELEAGIFSANAIKTAGAKIVAVGVGQGVSSAAAGLNLRSISGQMVDTDYFRTDDYAEAGAQLKDFALANCKGSVSVVKAVIPPGGTVADASVAGGWTFSGVGSGGVAVDSPSVMVTAPGTGAANFPLTFSVGTASAPVTLTETAQSGYTLELVAGKSGTCTRVDTGAAVPLTNTSNGFTVAANVGYPVSCTVYNRALQPPRLTLVKRVVSGTTGATGLPSDWILNAAGPTPISGPGGSLAVTNQKVGVGSYTFSESGGPDGYSASAWTCVGGQMTGEKLTLTYGDSATCTITNTAQQSRLTLVKTVTNDSGGTTSANAWTLTATGPTTGVSGSTGKPAVTGTPVAVGAYTLSETGPDGYRAGNWVCTRLQNGANSPVDVSEGAVLQVGVGQNISCAVNNDDQTRLLIQKWGAVGQGVVGPIAGAQFEIRANISPAPGGQGSPGAVVGLVTPVAGQIGVFMAAAYDPGDYWLVEVKAPQGNSLLATPVGFRIQPNGTLTITDGNPQAEIIDGSPQSLTMRITDVALIPLPQSGGAAPNATLVALILFGIGAMGVLLIRRQRQPQSVKRE